MTLCQSAFFNLCSFAPHCSVDGELLLRLNFPSMVEKIVKRPQLMWGRISFIFRQREFWLALIAFSAIGVIFWAFSRQLIYILHQGDIARDWILGFGFWAPLAYIGLFAMQILIAPMPGQFLGVMSGFVFGIFLGSFYSIVALTIGAGLAMYIARRFGRPLLERFVEPDQLRLWERKLYMRSPVNWGLLFVFPVPDFVFYLAGLSSIPLIRLVPAEYRPDPGRHRRWVDCPTASRVGSREMGVPIGCWPVALSP